MSDLRQLHCPAHVYANPGAIVHNVVRNVLQKAKKEKSDRKRKVADLDKEDPLPSSTGEQ